MGDVEISILSIYCCTMKIIGTFMFILFCALYIIWDRTRVFPSVLPAYSGLPLNVAIN